MSKEFIDKLYRNSEYYNLVKHTIIKNVGSINDNDLIDCIDEVFLKALKQKNLEDHSNIAGWLHLTSKHIAKQFKTKYDNDNRMLTELDENIPSTSNFIEDLEYEELAKIFFKDLPKKLSKSEYKFFELKYIKKYTNKEISIILGLTEEYVNVKCTRLKNKIVNFLLIR